MILDLVLPDGSGTDVCRELRTWSDAPVIVLSAVGEEREKIAALDAGADDYVTKPFSVDELLARLRAVLRRDRAERRARDRGRRARVDVPEAGRDGWRGSAVKLTPHEFDLLRVLAQNRGKLLTHRRSCGRSGGRRTRSRRTTSTSTSRTCARKIEPDRARPRYLLTEPGAGYRLVDPPLLSDLQENRQAGSRETRQAAVQSRSLLASRADVRPRCTRDRGRVLRLDLRASLGAGADLMSAADVFGLAISLAVLVYLVYALLRGERL